MPLRFDDIQRFKILEFLDSKPHKSASFLEIENEIAKEFSSSGLDIKDGKAIKVDFLPNRINQALDELLSQDKIQLNTKNTGLYNTEKNKLFYVISGKGAAVLLFDRMHGRITKSDEDAIDGMLYFCSDFGDINLDVLEKVINPMSLAFSNKDAVRWYLIGNGFCREDTNEIPDSFGSGLTYTITRIHFTDKGRLLKQKGSIHQYYQYLQEEKRKAEIAEIDRKIQSQRNRYQYWINVSIAVATGIAALYYFLEIFRIQYHWGLPGHCEFR